MPIGFRLRLQWILVAVIGLTSGSADFVMAQTVAECKATMATQAPPDNMAAMPNTNWQEPMPTAMAKDGMTKGEVPKMAMAHNECADKILKSDQTVMDTKKN